MGWLTDWITDWLRSLLVDGIMGNFSGLFTDVNNQVNEVAAQVGTSPAAWNAGVFSLIKQLSETVVLPIAGMILTFVMCYELISLIIDKNNMHEIDTWIFFKWFFKTFVAVMILSNTFNIVLAVFDVAQSVVNNAAGLISGSTSIPSDLLTNLEATLQGMDIGPLLGLWLQSFIVQLTAVVLNIVIFVIVYGRMIEIYLLTSLAPIPFATVGNREIGHVGHNYFKSLLAHRLSRVFDSGVHRHLCGAGAGDFHRRSNGHHGGGMAGHGVHGAAVLHPVQDRHTCQEHF